MRTPPLRTLESRRRRGRLGFLPLLCLAAAMPFLASCGAEEEAAPAMEEMERPTMSFSSAVYTLGRADFRPVIMRADVIELYDDKDEALLKHLAFEQRDDEGGLLMEGSCDEAAVDTKTYDAVLKGKVMINLPQEKFLISGSDLVWNHAAQKISTDKEVLLLYDAKSALRGEGFSCDFRTARCEFDEIIDGRLVP